MADVLAFRQRLEDRILGAGERAVDVGHQDHRILRRDVGEKADAATIASHVRVKVAHADWQSRVPFQVEIKAPAVVGPHAAENPPRAVEAREHIGILVFEIFVRCRVRELARKLLDLVRLERDEVDPAVATAAEVGRGPAALVTKPRDVGLRHFMTHVGRVGESAGVRHVNTHGAASGKQDRERGAHQA